MGGRQCGQLSYCLCQTRVHSRFLMSTSIREARLHQALRFGGRRMTYCVKGQVRRNLKSVGFATSVVPGLPGGKREVMIAWRLS